MRKYPPDSSVCGAVYDNAPANNPFLAAMPEMLPREQFMNAIRSVPGLPHNLPQMSPEERSTQQGMILATGMIIAFVVSIFVITFLMDYIKKHDFKVFGWYRIILGALVLMYFALVR